MATKLHEPVHELHHVYARAEDVRAYRRDGKFPDGAVLIGEASRRPGRQRARRWFGVLLVVVALMVLAAGFFGGALLYGIRHYDWP